MKVDTIDNIDYDEYDLFLKSVNSTFFNSSKFLHLLENSLEAENYFIQVKEGEQIKGILPFFVKSSKFGKVVNSLPFFGSYGGVISEEPQVAKIMLDELNRFNQENNVLSSVIIENPFSSIQGIYEKYFKYNTIDARQTQCTILNKQESELFQTFEKRVRWSIKKSEKNNVKIKKEPLSTKIISDFFNLHKKNMQSKNGQFKEQSFFELIKKIFKVGNEYDVFVGYYDEIPISFLLVFYYKNFSEYYIPEQNPNFKNLQSASKLIWESMKESIKKKITHYNFGGTPKDNQTLYRFKRGWNAEDYDYKYYIFRDIGKILEIDLEELKKLYQYFYILPYNEIQNSN